jgi:hypothetical protein
VKRQLRAWRRAQANDMPLDDPLVREICEAWEAINQRAIGPRPDKLVEDAGDHKSAIIIAGCGRSNNFLTWTGRSWQKSNIGGNMKLISLAMICGLLSATWALGGPVTITNQVRTDAASATAELDGTSDPQSDSDSAPDTGPFNGDAHATSVVTSGQNTVEVDARASQSSTIGEDSFQFSGSLQITRSFNNPDLLPDSYEASASSLADIDFHVGAPTTVSIPFLGFDIFPTPVQATLDYSVKIFQGATEIVSYDPIEDQIPDVELAPGDYTFKLLMSIAIQSPGLDSDGDFTDFSFSANFIGGNAIPLPPAVWSGMVALGLSGMPSLRRRLGSRP